MDSWPPNAVRPHRFSRHSRPLHYLSLGIGDDEVPFLLLLLIFHRLFLGPIRRIPIFQSLATGRIHIPQHLGDKRIDGALE